MNLHPIFYLLASVWIAAGIAVMFACVHYVNS